MKGTDLLTAKDIKFLMGVGQVKAYEIIKGIRKETKYDEFCSVNHIPGQVITCKLFLEKYPNFRADIKKLKEQQFNECLKS